MKTAEEILSNVLREVTGRSYQRDDTTAELFVFLGSIKAGAVLKAMEEYAAQFKQPEVGGKVPTDEEIWRLAIRDVTAGSGHEPTGIERVIIHAAVDGAMWMRNRLTKQP